MKITLEPMEMVGMHNRWLEQNPARHVGMLVSGKMKVVNDDGSEAVVSAGDAMFLSPVMMAGWWGWACGRLWIEGSTAATSPNPDQFRGLPWFSLFLKEVWCKRTSNRFYTQEKISSWTGKDLFLDVDLHRCQWYRGARGRFPNHGTSLLILRERTINCVFFIMFVLTEDISCFQPKDEKMLMSYIPGPFNWMESWRILTHRRSRCPGMEHFDPTCHGMREIRSEVWNDLVFINLDGRRDPFLSSFSPWTTLETILGTNGLECWSVQDRWRIDFELETNWKLAVETIEATTCQRSILHWTALGKGHETSSESSRSNFS